MAKVDLGSVVGPHGEKGDKGDAATVSIGTVSTGAAGSKVTVTNSGTSNAAVLNFSIPEGKQGETGAKGDNGITPTFSLEDGHLYVDYDTPYNG